MGNGLEQVVYDSKAFEPNAVFFTYGAGVNKHKLASFELALRDAGVSGCNLVHVSSIYPKGAKILPREEGLSYLRDGQILFSIDATLATREPNQLIAASVGAAIPDDPQIKGFLSEHHAYGQTDEEAAEYSQYLAALMLGSLQGIDIGEPSDNKGKKEYEFPRSDGTTFKVKTRHVTQSAVGRKDRLWTTVVAVCGLLRLEERLVDKK